MHTSTIYYFHLLQKVDLLYNAREESDGENKKAAVLLIFSKNVSSPQCI